jgi:hypothetical protein
VALVVLAFVAFVPACGDDDSAGPVSTTTSRPSTSLPATSVPTTTAPASTTTALSTDDRAFAVWPFVDSGTRYDDPVAAATGFAVELVGFDDPGVGPFQEGDSRSGEVEVRALADGGRVTTVLVRQLGPDGSWWVLGSTTANIQVAEPVPQSAIDHPLTVSGQSRAYEATVEVQIVVDGSTRGIRSSGGSDRIGAFALSFAARAAGAR